MMVNDMDIPEEFKNYGRMFIQDMHLFGNNIEEVIDYITRNYDRLTSNKLILFIDEIGKLQLSEEELRQIWAATDSDIYFHTADGFKCFLAMTRERLLRAREGDGEKSRL